MSALTRAEAAASLVLFAGERTRQLAGLIEERGSALALLRDGRGVDSGPPKLFNDEDVQDRLDKAAADIACWESEGIRVLNVLDPGYPDNLRGVHDRPPLIFVAGTLQAEDNRSVAVIGSRRASATGLEAAGAIAEHLVNRGYTVVSGLAAGIDTAAHRAALECRGRTVAVVGTGLRRCYPPGNAPLQRRIAETGAVVSRCWPDEPPSRRSFPARNAVMSGVARATVIVEASARSGARIQARLALAHGRPVFLRRPLLGQPWARELAQKPGTYVFASAHEVTARLERLEGEALVA